MVETCVGPHFLQVAELAELPWTAPLVAIKIHADFAIIFKSGQYTTEQV